MSEWKQQAARRRDARNIKDGLGHVQHARRKDRKRWCRGKAGVAHKPKCVDDDRFSLVGSRLYKAAKALICTECGKRLDSWQDWRDATWAASWCAKPRPAWVVLP